MFVEILADAPPSERSAMLEEAVAWGETLDFSSAGARHASCAVAFGRLVKPS